MLPYHWEECSDEAGCFKIVHVWSSAEEMNAIPQEWVVQFLDFQIVDSAIEIVNAEGLRHCDTGPAAERADGTLEWWVNDDLHREDGPAVVFGSGGEYWYRHGNLHREHGPAVTHSDGRREAYIDGEYLGGDNFDTGVRLPDHFFATVQEKKEEPQEEEFSHEFSEYF